jgi:hypothetical protein
VLVDFILFALTLLGIALFHRHTFPIALAGLAEADRTRQVAPVGSMIWFGLSAGVALANIHPEAKSVGLWLRHGWHIAVAYVIGFFFMLAIIAGIPTPITPNAA